MKLNLRPDQLYIPDMLPLEKALERTTHLAIGAHHDDLEIMAIDGILQCYQQTDKWFTGVIMTDGSGSPRSGIYKDYSDDEMCAVRVEEQKKAAKLGEYAAQIFLEYPSDILSDSTDNRPLEDIMSLLKATTPEVVYTHNPTDKHDTHIGVLLKVLNALWCLPAKQRPKRLYGCEVWGDLDWLPDEDKIVFDTSTHEELQTALVEIFDSQISGGKRYDLAIMGRRRAHATYYEPYKVDIMKGAAFAMDLSSLITMPEQDIEAFVEEKIRRFSNDVRRRIQQFG
jgi:LmbE family N-acetylglucosaminyl deacetylase